VAVDNGEKEQGPYLGCLFICALFTACRQFELSDEGMWKEAVEGLL
jgi:hypothetical protein